MSKMIKETKHIEIMNIVNTSIAVTIQNFEQLQKDFDSKGYKVNSLYVDSANPDYDEPANLVVFIERPETPAELKKREYRAQAAKKAKVTAAERALARRKAQYEKLRQEFG